MMVHQPTDRINAPRREAEQEPSLAEWRSRCLLAQSIISHRFAVTPDVVDVLAVLRGDLSLDGAE